MIEINRISKSYQMGDTAIHALSEVSLTIESGEFVAIMGPSGSGKSTLMHILGLLDVPDVEVASVENVGSYRLCGVEVSGLSEDRLAELRRKTIGFIFQQFNLLPRITATENVAVPLLYSESRIDYARARKLLEEVGLGSRLEHKTNELSGGQQQRVAIARSLINQPAIILADEPTGNLDSQSEHEIMAILTDLNRQGITVIIVTHEEEIGAHASRIIRMRDGKIQSDTRSRALPAHKVEPALATVRENGQNDSAQSPVGPSFFVEFMQYFIQGFRQLLSNKIRTALSMLGILIGVGAVVAVLALGTGAQQAIEAQLASLGSNLLVLRPGAQNIAGVFQSAGSATRLTLEDASAIQSQVTEAKEVAPAVNSRAQVAYGNKNWNTQVTGVTASYGQMHASEPVVGRFFTIEENLKRKRVAVIGMTLVRELFGDVNPIGEMLKIDRVNFLVIGVLPEKGANSFRDQDDVVIVPVLTAMKRLFGKTYVDYIEIEMKDAKSLDSASDSIKQVVLNRHRILPAQSEEAFQIRNMADIQEALASSSKTMSVLLSAIAAISLLVGGIGIMNIMLVSVTERTKEIGLRKAIGAKRWNILSQFLSEAIVVSTVGGVMGICLGWLVTVVLTIATGWNTTISIASVLLAFFFSATIGVVFGIYPATKASKLHPIVALRHE